MSNLEDDINRMGLGVASGDWQETLRFMEQECARDLVEGSAPGILKVLWQRMALRRVDVYVLDRMDNLITELELCGELSVVGAEEWHRKIRTCPGHPLTQNWCAYCGQLFDDPRILLAA